MIAHSVLKEHSVVERRREKNERIEKRMNVTNFAPEADCSCLVLSLPSAPDCPACG